MRSMTALSVLSISSQLVGMDSRQTRPQAIFWLKNRRPSEWRDVQQLGQVIGRYLISDRPLTEDEWIEQRTKVIEAKVTQQLPEANHATEKLAVPVT